MNEPINPAPSREIRRCHEAVDVRITVARVCNALWIVVLALLVIVPNIRSGPAPPPLQAMLTNPWLLILLGLPLLSSYMLLTTYSPRPLLTVIIAGLALAVSIYISVETYSSLSGAYHYSRDNEAQSPIGGP